MSLRDNLLLVLENLGRLLMEWAERKRQGPPDIVVDIRRRWSR